MLFRIKHYPLSLGPVVTEVSETKTVDLNDARWFPYETV